MRLRKSVQALLVALVFLALVSVSAQSHSPGSSSQIKRSVLQRTPIAGTELEMRVVLIEYPPGAAASLHHHPVAGINYILEGTAETAFGNDAPHTYRTGETFLDKDNQPHTIFRNASQTKPLRFLVYYAIKPGEPTLITP